jgi:hypothetical protein
MPLLNRFDLKGTVVQQKLSGVASDINQQTIASILFFILFCPHLLINKIYSALLLKLTLSSYRDYNYR